MITYMRISFSDIVVGSRSGKCMAEVSRDTLSGAKSHSTVFGITRRIDFSHTSSSNKG